MATPGVCAIKPEFLLRQNTNTEINGIRVETEKNGIDEAAILVEPAEKKIRIDVQIVQEKGKKSRGQNKARPKTFQEDKRTVPCRTIMDVPVTQDFPACTFKNCIQKHDPLEYLQNKPKDISDECYLFNARGHCMRGMSCRFSTKHITPEGKNLIDEEKLKQWTSKVFNSETRTLQFQLERRKYDLSLAEKVKNVVEQTMIEKREKKEANKKENEETSDFQSETNERFFGSVTDEDIIKLKSREKKKIDWRDKLYLSPLTTVGNLPFRRICKQFGVDVTCGEMALCESLLKGNKQEWALVKRHSSEDLFGIQICGPSPTLVSRVAQVVEDNMHVDFVDLNLGCPIDLVYQRGGGCGMMLRQKSLEATIRCASTILSVPFTVKMRTGVYQDKKIAHTLIPNIVNYGASMITLHGRSREARYSRLADWEYIEQCAAAANPCPVFGNGDILSYEDYMQRREMAKTVQGVMIGRGALIKPWIFTEIKEQRLWDIRSSERMDIIKKYVNYGLEHWGSDTMGVENTRRFLLEWLSFLYRYVPVGLLERPPQKINERPETFFGRDDLETLMASGNCSDWIKISEMLLGPVPPGFQFLPKHKASAYK